MKSHLKYFYTHCLICSLHMCSTKDLYQIISSQGVQVGNETMEAKDVAGAPAAGTEPEKDER